LTFSYVDNYGNTIVLPAAQSSPGVWTYTAPGGLTDSTGHALAPGTYNLDAVASDNFGVASDPLAISFTVTM
jgi:hypothetical protein